MKTANIPDVVQIKGKLFNDDYRKRKMKSKDLYCWFPDNFPDYPHASVDICHEHENWSYFHVTFPVVKERGGWDSGTETVSYSVHVEIDQERDTLSVVRTTDASRWRLPGVQQPGPLFADMNRKGLEFAKLFYSFAFAQM